MPKKSSDTGNYKCSFCSKSQEEVKKLIAGPTVYICDECIELCNEIMVEEWTQEKNEDFKHLLKPREINTHLDQYIIGQEKSKRILSVAVHNHFKRVDANTETTIQSSQRYSPGYSPLNHLQSVLFSNATRITIVLISMVASCLMSMKSP